MKTSVENCFIRQFPLLKELFTWFETFKKIKGKTP